jgi:hypothetical protein
MFIAAMHGAAGREEIGPEARIQQNDRYFDYNLSFKPFNSSVIQAGKPLNWLWQWRENYLTFG